VEHARSRQAAKRGGGMAEHSLEALVDGEDEAVLAIPSSDDWMALLQLHQALEQLEALDPRQARVVELRFFGGLSVEQTAGALDISVATVKREWSTARAWLMHALATA
jgi:RNA polymerase sigma factor (TIGR02999 family)